MGTPRGLGAFTPPLPVVVTKAASSVMSASALLNATVNPKCQPVSQCTFEYGTTTTHHFRIKAADAFGTSNGKDRAFKTT